MNIKRLFQVFLFSFALMGMTATAQVSQQRVHSQQPVTNTQQKVQKSQPMQSGKVEAQVKTQSHKSGNVVRATTAVKLRRTASSKASTVKNKKGQTVVVPKGAAVNIVKSSGNFYKVTYKGYTGYIAKKYTAVHKK